MNTTRIEMEFRFVIVLCLLWMSGCKSSGKESPAEPPFAEEHTAEKQTAEKPVRSVKSDKSDAPPDPSPTNHGWVRIKPLGNGHAARLARDEIERLQALGYLDGSKEPEKGLSGVTVHDKVKTVPGLNIVVSGHGYHAALMDSSGRVLHSWQKDVKDAFPGQKTHADHFRRAVPFPNGDLLVIYNRADGMVKLDRCSNILWAVQNGAHHDFEIQPNGDIFALVRDANIIPEIDPQKPILEDFVVVLGPDGKELRRVSLLTAMKTSKYEGLFENRHTRTGDVFHTNSVTVLPKGELPIPEIKAGNVLVSILKLNLIAVLDMAKKKFVWTYAGGFGGQHDAQLLKNGHFLLFDNKGTGPQSRILELDAAGSRTVWSYPENRQTPFKSATRGRVQRFETGNTLITETDSGRAFEVTPEGKIVWEYYNPMRAGANDRYIAALLDVHRLPIDFPTDWIAGSCAP